MLKCLRNLLNLGFLERLSLKVISGKKGGTKLKGARGKDFRPTTQLVKGSVFDHLQNEVEGSVVLDLFSGSGGLGIEALSRGAEKSTFVEINRNAVKAIRSNIEKCRFSSDHAEVIRTDSVRFLKKAVLKGYRYDIIIADPPYKSSYAEEILKVINGAGRKICGLLVIESSKELESVSDQPMEKYKAKKFGNTCINYFRYIES
ncbi:MAG TPA: 16S rRNA (guanine(966)-N(2))-methyltransferase RsmD [Candidatus Krumholzibacteriaceae bacterium]|nr:16S rRNA (guanine(966)-N(2))-methyltransferase RsmD [Candidatus Krumholzibacteriaceae bacterium]